MDQSPSWQTDSHSTSQEIPWLLWNPKIHYRVHNSPPLVPILSQMHPVLTDWLTDWLTPCSRILPQKLIVTQVVEKFPGFYGTQRFIIVFTRARHWSLTWDRCIKSVTSYPISLRSILILSSHLRIGLQSGLFPSSLPMRAACLAILILLDFITPLVYGEAYKLWSTSLFSLLSDFYPFLPLRSEDFPQHPVLTHAPSVFVPTCKGRVSLPRIVTLMKSIIGSLYAHLYFVPNLTQTLSITLQTFQSIIHK
jgi:hypothetical protein